MSDDILELVGNYETYMEAEELDVAAVTDAPATSWYCVSASFGASFGATYEATC